MDCSKGSEWRKWDLHVHTPYSYSNHFPEWGQYVIDLKEKAVSHDILVMGVTDYFSVDGYERLLDECELETKNENPGILLSNGKYLYLMPIVELRLDNFTSEETSVNLHIAFSPKILPSTIRDCFLENLPINYQDKTLKCKENDLVKIGDAELNGGAFNTNLDISTFNDVEKKKRIKKALSIITFSSNSFAEKLEEFEKLLSKQGMKKENFLLLIANKGHGGLSDFNWIDNFGNLSRAGVIRQNLLNLSDICFSNKINDRNFLLGLTQNTDKEEVINRFRTLKPCIWGSDSHSVDTLFHPSNGNSDDYTWVKADPTFDGLKQIIYEPECRVKIQKSSPALDKTKLVIDSLEISNSSDYIIPDERIELNRDLVCIIGGRGSGKSALLESIAYCFDVHLQNEKPQSLIPYYQKEGVEAKLSLQYKDLDGNPIALYETSLQNKNEEPCTYPFLYISQNQIEKFATDSQYLHGLAFETVIINSSFTEELRRIQSTIDDLLKEVEGNFLKIINQRELIAKVDQKALEIETNKLKGELKLLESESTREVLNKLNEAQEKKSTIIQAKDIQDEILVHLSDTKEFLNIKIAELYTQLEILGISYPSLEFNFVDIENHINVISALIDSIDKENEYQQMLAEVKNILKDKLDVSIEHIEALRNKILSNEVAIKTYQKEKDLFSNLIKVRYQLLEKLNSFFEGYESTYNKAIEEFTTTNQDILGPLELETELVFNTEKLCAILLETCVDRRKIKSIDKLREYLDLLPSITYRQYIDWINLTFSEEFNIGKYDAFYVSLKNEIEKEIVFTHPRLSTKINYKLGSVTKGIDQLSLGQKGTILLKLFLSIGNNCPIIIDQPEDHLDNAFIYSDLVQTIRNAKKKRQVIVVTHNANLLVNGDAEQVIVANYENEKITHSVAGSLENPRIKEKVTTILEGGMEAFRKRERKYQFNDTLVS